MRYFVAPIDGSSAIHPIGNQRAVIRGGPSPRILVFVTLLPLAEQGEGWQL